MIIKVENGSIEIESIMLKKNGTMELKITGNELGVVSISGLEPNAKYRASSATIQNRRGRKDDYISDNEGMLKVSVHCDVQDIAVINILPL